ncbi:hypothetical protein JW930_01765 [Candidatus Woesearchaeota archaeon]|nr:hypothetical protein [Candidatus Woesearchaeota archaeon]
MNGGTSQFERGRRDNYLSSFQKSGYSWNYDHPDYSAPGKYEYNNLTDSAETSQNSDEYVFRIPLGMVSIENLKIIPAKTYLIVQSNKKTIFIKFDHRIKPETMSILVRKNRLVIHVKKWKKE